MGFVEFELDGEVIIMSNGPSKIPEDKEDPFYKIVRTMSKIADEALLEKEESEDKQL
jgi:hypothetical protein